MGTNHTADSLIQGLLPHYSQIVGKEYHLTGRLMVVITVNPGEEVYEVAIVTVGVAVELEVVNHEMLECDIILGWHYPPIWEIGFTTVGLTKYVLHAGHQLSLPIQHYFVNWPCSAISLTGALCCTAYTMICYHPNYRVKSWAFIYVMTKLLASKTLKVTVYLLMIFMTKFPN